MDIHLLTLFPGLFRGPLDESILKKAQEKGHLTFHLHDLRAATTDPHRTADDTPYGGGIGMVMKIEPIVKTLEQVPRNRVIYLSPQGKPFSQTIAQNLAKEQSLTFICGRYEGIDARIRSYCTDEISLGDFIVTGGEIAVLPIIDATVRFIPGVVGQASAPYQDSFSEHLLEFPQFTKPETFQGESVPPVLRSGNHQAIATWRKKQALAATLFHRSDLLQHTLLNQEDQALLKEVMVEAA